MKDIVAESAPTYVSIYPGPQDAQHQSESRSLKPSNTPVMRAGDEKDASEADEKSRHDDRAFSLARFIPLLSERVYVISPYTRMHLVSWLMVLDSIPDLELVAWLPEFLDGLL